MIQQRAVLDLYKLRGFEEPVVGMRFESMKKVTEFLQDYCFNQAKKIRKIKCGEKMANTYVLTRRVAGTYVCITVQAPLITGTFAFRL